MTNRQLLLPQVIARLRGLDLRARTVVAGVLSGMHRSVYRGQSVEFAEHRAYVPGDDIRRIDWRLFGRKDRFFIKQYEEETNLRCNLVVDVSRSMRYGSGPLSKFDYGACLAASLAYLLARQNDATGLVTFDSRLRHKLSPTTGRAQLGNIVSILESAGLEAETDAGRVFHQLAQELRRRSVVVLISDLLGDPDEIVDGLEHLGYTGHELILFHVLDRDEWTFPFVDNTRFDGLEDDTCVVADPQSLQAGYLDALQRFVTRIRGICLKHRGDYVPVDTRGPLDGLLTAYLSGRAGGSPTGLPLHAPTEAAP